MNVRERRRIRRTAEKSVPIGSHIRVLLSVCNELRDTERPEEDGEGSGGGVALGCEVLRLV